MSLGGDHSGIDAHIATLEEALDALKRERYSRDCSASGETDDGTRQRDEDKARALASENDLLLRVFTQSDAGKRSPLITSHVLTKTTPRDDVDDDDVNDDDDTNDDDDETTTTTRRLKSIVQSFDESV